MQKYKQTIPTVLVGQWTSHVFGGASLSIAKQITQQTYFFMAQYLVPISVPIRTRNKWPCSVEKKLDVLERSHWRPPKGYLQHFYLC
jgi:hypothetical protein